MNICRVETIEVNVVERMWLDKVQAMCESIAREANHPEIVGSAELAADCLNSLLAHVVVNLTTERS